MVLSRMDYIIIRALNDNAALTAEAGMTLRELSSEESLDAKTNTLYKRVKALLAGGIVKKGVPVGKADSFFLADAGLKLIGKEVHLQ